MGKSTDPFPLHHYRSRRGTPAAYAVGRTGDSVRGGGMPSAQPRQASLGHPD